MAFGIGMVCTIIVGIAATLFSDTRSYSQSSTIPGLWERVDFSKLGESEITEISMLSFGYTTIEITTPLVIPDDSESQHGSIHSRGYGTVSVVARMQMSGWPLRSFWSQQIYFDYTRNAPNGWISAWNIPLEGLSIFGWEPSHEYLPIGIRIIPFLVNSFFYAAISAFVIWRIRKRREFVRLLRVVEREINQKTQG